VCMVQRVLFLFILQAAFFYNSVSARDVETHILEIVGHKFFPKILNVSRDKLIKLEIFNKDATVEEFESFDLKREKIVPSHKKIVVTVGPLKPGEYSFFGEFHQDTAQGKIIVK